MHGVWLANVFGKVLHACVLSSEIFFPHPHLLPDLLEQTKLMVVLCEMLTVFNIFIPIPPFLSNKDSELIKLLSAENPKGSLRSQTSSFSFQQNNWSGWNFLHAGLLFDMSRDLFNWSIDLGEGGWTGEGWGVSFLWSFLCQQLEL